VIVLRKKDYLLFTFAVIILLSGMLPLNVNAISVPMQVSAMMITNEKVPIIITLTDKPSFQTLPKENGISILKEKSSRSQRDILTFLNEEKNKDKADKIKQFWIVNAIAVNVTPELIEVLSARDDVESIELDSKMHMIEDYPVQVSMGQIDNATTDIKRINSTKAWEIGIDGTGINVSVIDTGINASHPDISGRVIKWVDYINNKNSPYDDYGHGTHVAGTVGGNGSGGTTTGVAPNVSLFGAKVLDSSGNGDSSDVIRAIEWSVENKADIISISLGGDRDLAMKNALNNAIGSGVTVIAAAGNSGPGSGTINFPAGEKNVIAVGATDRSDKIAYFSSTGPITVDGEILTKPDVSAPGVGITSLNYLTTGYITSSGTSMATPHVSGTVALMLQNARLRNITLNSSWIINILAGTSIDLGAPGKDNTYGWGRIDAYNATMYISGIDTIPPSVTVNPNQAGNSAKNGSVITLNATISDNYGVRNASVNVSAINKSLSSIFLSNSGGYWKVNVTADAIDGIYPLNFTAYDYSNNINNSTQTLVIVDNTPPILILNPVSYRQGNAARSGGLVEINVSAQDPIINDASSGLKNASLNASAINSMGWIALTNNSGFWNGNITLDKPVDDGNYPLNVIFSDNAGNINNSMHVNISVDNTPPLVNDLSVSSGFINLTDSINITADITSSDNISGVNKSELYARVKYPNGASIDYNLSSGSGSLFYKNFTDTAQYGRYDINILANDTTGNMNNSRRIQFITTYMTNLVVNITGENTETYDAPYSNVSMILKTNNSVNGTINISRSKVNLSSNAFEVTNPGIYVLFTGEGIKNNLSYVILRVNYRDNDVSSYVESSLRLYRWNISSSGWDKLPGSGSYPYVNDAGVDTVNNFVWANLTIPGEFAISGDVYSPQVNNNPSSGGGGGGGGGTSGENFSNIEMIEKYDLSIYKDKVTSFRFTGKENPIVFVNITGNVNFGDITTSVEVLRNTSNMVGIEPPGMIYKNANIWVGSSSFNSPRNIKNGSIRFSVKNSWIEENHIVNVRMLKWNKKSWVTLETKEVSKDEAVTYYDAFAQEFSNFAITGIKEETAIHETTAQEIRPMPLVKQEPVRNATPVTGPTKENPGFGSILAILCLWGVHRFKRKRN